MVSLGWRGTQLYPPHEPAGEHMYAAIGGVGGGVRSASAVSARLAKAAMRATIIATQALFNQSLRPVEAVVA